MDNNRTAGNQIYTNFLKQVNMADKINSSSHPSEQDTMASLKDNRLR